VVRELRIIPTRLRVTEQVQELLRHFAGFLGWVDSHIVSPSLLEFQFYGLAAEITLQFYEWTC
jgi:hypothetical protein